MYLFNAIKNSISRQFQTDQVLNPQVKDTVIEKTKDLYDSSVFIGFKEGPNQIKKEITIEYKNDKVLNKIKELENEQEWEFIKRDIDTKIDEVIFVQPFIEEDIPIVKENLIDIEKTIIEYEGNSRNLKNSIIDFEAKQKKNSEVTNMMNSAKKRISELTNSMRKSQNNEEIYKLDDEQKRLSDRVIPTCENELHNIRSEIEHEKPQYTKNLLTIKEVAKNINNLKNTRQTLEKIYDEEDYIVKNLSNLKNKKTEREEINTKLQDLNEVETKYTSQLNDLNEIEKKIKDPKTTKETREFNNKEYQYRKPALEKYRKEHLDELEKIPALEINKNQLDSEIDRIERDTVRSYLDLKEDKKKLFS